MEESYESFFDQEGPFYPTQMFHMDSWKKAVQDVVNKVIRQALNYPVEDRNVTLLIDIFKTTWKVNMSSGWFRYETSYYLWLVHVSGLLLPLLEQEDGVLRGWLQYRKYSDRRDGLTFTVPIIEETDRLKLYLFEKKPVILSSVAEAMAINASYSSVVFPDLLQIDSLEDGRSNIHTLSSAHKRKQDW
ncbi:hypothetical protein D7Z54_16815 [Salibacterium salarium]|uniref:Uncharacterized protein n=1 Tax=Salibacterium salarium TaxID=284579 RepID=A0A428N1J9_9BACI|nr:hypothetical protein [Salibacterium salarium]RSL32311.1 hypothetical protein D7Z54_16815 [Salibacterium salarium]